MTDTNQKLREALSELIEAYNRAGPELSRAERAVDRMRLIAAHEALALLTVPAISDTWGISRALVTLYAYECDGATDKALALITANHIPDAGEMVADHLPDAGKMIETAAPGGGYVRPVVLDARQALPTAAQVDDINVAESFTSAAPVGEREAFEKWILDATGYIGASVKRDQEGQYKSDITESAWDAWQARAALSAGDAVDAHRYQWLTDGKRGDWVWNHVLTEEVKGDHSQIECAIDAAMRKGQL